MPVVEALALSGAKIGHGGDRVALVVTELLEKFGLPDLIRVLELALVFSSKPHKHQQPESGRATIHYLDNDGSDGPQTLCQVPILSNIKPIRSGPQSPCRVRSAATRPPFLGHTNFFEF